MLMDERVRAAYCELRHGDPHDTDEVAAARKGQSDLIGRTWRAEREMSRDERRLMGKYRRTLSAADEARVKAWRECPRCSGQTERD